MSSLWSWWSSSNPAPELYTKYSLNLSLINLYPLYCRKLQGHGHATTPLQEHSWALKCRKQTKSKVEEERCLGLEGEVQPTSSSLHLLLLLPTSHQEVQSSSHSQQYRHNCIYNASQVANSSLSMWICFPHTKRVKKFKARNNLRYSLPRGYREQVGKSEGSWVRRRRGRTRQVHPFSQFLSSYMVSGT